jgi:hypothetical protein
MTETLTWIPVATKPDSDITVLLWLEESQEWLSGWWDDLDGCWYDAASIAAVEGAVVEGVTHWADVLGPQ